MIDGVICRIPATILESGDAMGLIPARNRHLIRGLTVAIRVLSVLRLADRCRITPPFIYGPKS
jgi:hypothetical protein